MSDVLINFTGSYEQLEGLIDVLDQIAAKEGAVGEKWKQVRATMTSSNADIAASNTKLSGSIDDVTKSQKDVATQAKVTGAALGTQNKTGVDGANKLTKSIEGLSNASKKLTESIVGGAYASALKQIASQIDGFTEMGVRGAQKLSEELFKLIQNEENLKDAIKNSTDPALTKQYEESLKETTATITVLRTALNSLQELKIDVPVKLDPPSQDEITALINNIREQISTNKFDIPVIAGAEQKLQLLDTETQPYKDLASAISDVKVAMGGLSTKEDEVNEKTKNLENAGDAYAASLKGVSDEIDKYSTMGVEGARKISAEITNLIGKEEILKNAIESSDDPELTEKYKASLQENTKEIDLLTAALEKLKAAGFVFDSLKDKEVEVTEQAKNLNDVIGGGKFGNYLNQIKSQMALPEFLAEFPKITSQIKITKEEIVDYLEKLKSASQQSIVNSKDPAELDNLNKSIGLINGQLVKMGVIEDGVGDNTQTLQQRLKDAKAELEKLIETGKTGDELDFAKNKVVGLQELQSKLKTTNADIIQYILNAKKAAQQKLLSTTDPKEIQQLNQGIDGLNARLKSLGANEDGVAQTTRRLRTQLLNMKQQLLTMDAGSPEFEKLFAQTVKVQQEIKDLNRTVTNAASDTRNLDGLVSIASGIAGGFSAAQGAIALFSDGNEDLQKALLKVNAAMAITYGLQQLGNVITAKSSANQFLNTLFRKANTAAIGEQTIAEEASNAQKAIAIAETRGITLAEAQQVVVTESATLAQAGFNLAMLASPVGILIGSIIALYGAYELYTHTLGEATDAEKEHTAALEAADEANKKVVDNIAKEESSLASLLITLKSENASKQDKEDALNELSAKYPEYLGQLTTENVLTAKGSELIAKQIELIKEKALVAAKEELFTEALKKQLAVQNEIARIQAGGALTVGQSIKAAINQYAFDETPAESMIRLLNGDLKDLSVNTKAVFDGLSDSSEKLADLYQLPIDKLNSLNKTLDFFVNKNKGIMGELAGYIQAGLNQQQSSISAFNKKQYDEDYQLAKAEAQRKIDLVKSGDAAGLASAQANLAKIEKAYVEKDEAINKSTAKGQSEIDDADAKYQAGKNSRDDAARARAYKAQTDDAQSLLIQLEANGQKESDAYFDAKKKAIKAASAEQINQARYNSAAINKIQQEENLQLVQNEIDRTKNSLEQQKSLINARLILAKKGSQQEYNDRIAFIDNEEKQELKVLGLTEQKRDEINAKYQKQRQDADDAFQQAQLQNQISNANTELANFSLTEKQKLPILLKRLDEEEKIEIIAAKDNVAKVNEIQTAYDAKRLAAVKNEIDAEYNYRLQKLQADQFTPNLRSQAIVDDPNVGTADRLKANKDLEDSMLAQYQLGLEHYRKLLALKDLSLEDHQKYTLAIENLDNQAYESDKKNQENIVKIYQGVNQKKIELFRSSLVIIQNGIDTLDTSALKTGLTGVIDAFGKVSDAVKSYNDALLDPNVDKKAAKQAEVAAIASASIVATQATINQVYADAATRRQQELQDNLQGLEDEKNVELSNANLTAKQKAAISAKFAAKERAIKIEAFKADKKAKIEQAIINGLLAVTNALATVQPFLPFAPIAAALAAAMTAVQVAAINSQPTPKFKHGQIDIQGPGTSTSDSIHAKISKGESVIAAEPTAKWKDVLIAINKGTYEDHLAKKIDVATKWKETMVAINNNKVENYISRNMHDFVFPHIPNHVQPIHIRQKEIDYDRLSSAIADKMREVLPESKSIEFNVDKNGMHTIIKDGNSKIEHKNKRYKMS